MPDGVSDEGPGFLRPKLVARPPVQDVWLLAVGRVWASQDRSREGEDPVPKGFRSRARGEVHHAFVHVPAVEARARDCSGRSEWRLRTLVPRGGEKQKQENGPWARGAHENRHRPSAREGVTDVTVV